jgi:hypothetical protein
VTSFICTLCIVPVLSAPDKTLRFFYGKTASADIWSLAVVENAHDARWEYMIKRFGNDL